MKTLILAILAGDDTERDSEHASTLAVSEDGMVSFVAMVAVLFFVILIGLIGNIGLTINQKLEVQNAADSTAYSSGTFTARGMNSVTASNHVIGEVLGLAVMHHAICGPELDESFTGSSRIPSQERSRVNSYKQQLETAHTLAKVFSNGNSIPLLDLSYNMVRQGPTATEGATVFRSKVRLMKVLTSALRAYAAGGYLQTVSPPILSLIPFVGPALAQIAKYTGVALSAIAVGFDAKVAQEWVIVQGLSVLAHVSAPLKTFLRQIVRVLYWGTEAYAGQGVFALLPLARHSALMAELKKQNLADSATYFGRGQAGLLTAMMPALPIAREPSASELQAAPWKSQLIRATYPWVYYWRQRPMRLFRSLLRLSRAAHHYKDFTNQFTRELAFGLKNEGVNLYILRELDLTVSDKGMEPWTRADEDDLRDTLFTNVGFAHRERPPLASSGFYPEENGDGFVGYAQAIVYNANARPNKPKPYPGARMQPRFAWDTLNWMSDVPEYFPTPGNATEDSTGAYTYWPGEPVVFRNEPQMFINWRTKLVPVSRLKSTLYALPSPYGPAVRRLPVNPVMREHTIFRTH